MLKVEDIQNKILEGKRYSFSDWEIKTIKPIIPPENVKFKYKSKYGLSDWTGDIDCIFPEYHMKYNSFLKRSICEKIIWNIRSTRGNIYELNECELIKV